MHLNKLDRFEAIESHTFPSEVRLTWAQLNEPYTDWNRLSTMRPSLTSPLMFHQRTPSPCVKRKLFTQTSPNLSADSRVIISSCKGKLLSTGINAFIPSRHFRDSHQELKHLPQNTPSESFTWVHRGNRGLASEQQQKGSDNSAWISQRVRNKP